MHDALELVRECVGERPCGAAEPRLEEHGAVDVFAWPARALVVSTFARLARQATR